MSAILRDARGISQVDPVSDRGSWAILSGRRSPEGPEDGAGRATGPRGCVRPINTTGGADASAKTAPASTPPTIREKERNKRKSVATSTVQIFAASREYPHTITNR